MTKLAALSPTSTEFEQMTTRMRNRLRPHSRTDTRRLAACLSRIV